MKKIDFWYMLGLFMLCSCYSNEEGQSVDHSEKVVGRYQVEYLSNSFTDLESFIEIDRVGENEIEIKPPADIDHTSFTAKLDVISGGVVGIEIPYQASGKYYVYGEKWSSVVFDGGVSPEDNSVFYTIIYEAFGEKDTVSVTGVLVE